MILNRRDFLAAVANDLQGLRLVEVQDIVATTMLIQVHANSSGGFERSPNSYQIIAFGHKDGVPLIHILTTTPSKRSKILSFAWTEVLREVTDMAPRPVGDDVVKIFLIQVVD